MSYKFIVMTCGYVESAATSSLIYSCGFMGNGKGYESCKDAITELALDMYAKYADDYLKEDKIKYPCCHNQLVDRPQASFCSDCGSKIRSDNFNSETFQSMISDLHNSTCDSYGEAEFANDRNFCWWPWSNSWIGRPKEEFIYIPEQAEWVLLEALYDAKPELKEKIDNCIACRQWEEFKVK